MKVSTQPANKTKKMLKFFKIINFTNLITNSLSIHSSNNSLYTLEQSFDIFDVCLWSNIMLWCLLFWQLIGNFWAKEKVKQKKFQSADATSNHSPILHTSLLLGWTAAAMVAMVWVPLDAFDWRSIFWLLQFAKFL